MVKKEMKLSALIETMRGIAAEGNRFVVCDSFHDVVRISREAEEIEDADIEDEYKEGEWFWCLRKNGTSLSSFKSSVDEFAAEYPNEAVAAYKIQYKSRRFSIARVKELGNEFFD